MPDPRPKLLVISHVQPFPRKNGQQQRVYYTLRAARERFHTTFLGYARADRRESLQRDLLTVCDEVALLPSLYDAGAAGKLWHRVQGEWFAWRTGLRFSNYEVGQVELSPARVAEFLGERSFDLVLFEYWHAVRSVAVCQQRGFPCVLDMHNVLWQSHLQKLKEEKPAFESWRRKSIENYRQAEEAAWLDFDGVVAITREEEAYVRPRVAAGAEVFYAPMGIDLAEWPFHWQPADPPRFAYYGGLGSRHNQEAALRCHAAIMPLIWAQFPQAELWLVGSNPSPVLQALTKDPRVKVTGYVEKVQDVLRTMTAVLCPWQGTYGFRSRLIEVMALGVPVVATPEAACGMELVAGSGFLTGSDDAALAAHGMTLMRDRIYAGAQSKAARQQVEQLYGMAQTYGRLMEEMERWLVARQADSSSAGRMRCAG